MARKKIKKVSVAELKPITGSIVDTTNIDDKTVNTYSANVIDKFNTYSTEETFTGKYWIDGKKIYGKVIKSKTGSNNADNFFPHNVNNLDHMIHHEAKIYNTWDIWNLPFQTEDTMFKFAFVKDRNAFRESHTNSYWNNWDIEIIFEYTKTTNHGEPEIPG